MPAPRPGQARPPNPPTRRPSLWTDVLTARRTELTDLGERGSREMRRPDERRLWLSDLGDAYTAAVDAIDGASSDDPRDALIQLLAVASAYVHAMDERPVLT